MVRTKGGRTVRGHLNGNFLMGGETGVDGLDLRSDNNYKKVKVSGTTL